MSMYAAFQLCFSNVNTELLYIDIFMLYAFVCYVTWLKGGAGAQSANMIWMC